jgi:hypothetical protein
MPAGRYSFTLEEGATFNLQIDWTDENDTPIDLTGYQARMYIKPHIDSNTILISLSSSFDEFGTGIGLTGTYGNYPLESGSIAIQISAESSEGLDFDNGYYDLELIKDEYVVRVLEGRVKFSKNITR